jgi:hypothetical protein
MTFKTPPKAFCPHCGFESDVEELCPACGKLADGDIPVRKVSLGHIFDAFVSGLQDQGFHGTEDNELIDINASDDPGLAHLPGNSYHYIWSEDED